MVTDQYGGQDTIMGADSLYGLQGTDFDDVLTGNGTPTASAATAATTRSTARGHTPGTHDQVDYANATAGIVVNLGNGTNGTATGDSLRRNNDMLINIDGVIGIGFCRRDHRPG